MFIDELLDIVFRNHLIDDELYNEISSLGIKYLEKNVEFISSDGFKIIHNKIEINDAIYYLFRFAEKDFSGFISGINSEISLKIFNNIEKGITVLKNKKDSISDIKYYEYYENVIQEIISELNIVNNKFITKVYNFSIKFHKNHSKIK